METAMNIAAYIAGRYEKEYGAPIDEMKLHKLLYFAQREALIQLNAPLFPEQFHAWVYGPVLVEVRDRIRCHGLASLPEGYVLPEKYEPVMDEVFKQYAVKSSWSLSRLSHGELSWKNARGSLPENAACDVALSLDDIKLDAQRIKVRRAVLTVLKGE